MKNTYPVQFDKYNRPVRIPEKNTGETLVEVKGYITAEKRINDMINAGMRLQESRKELYDFYDGNAADLSFSDPTRSPNYDMADAFQSQVAAKNRLRRSQMAQEASKMGSEGNNTPEPSKEPVKASVKDPVKAPE